MKVMKILFFILLMSFIGFVQAEKKREIVADTRFIVADAVHLISYLSSCSEAHQKYLDTHDHELSVSCKGCDKEFIELGKFEGGLIGKGLKDLIDGKDNFKETKIVLDKYLKLLADGSDREILAFMAQILNDQEYVCYSCKGINWEYKIIE